MNRNKQTQALINLKEKKQLFSILSQNDASWEEIMKGFFSFHVYNALGQEIKKHIFHSSHIQVLEEFGLSHDFKDNLGNKFFHYMFENQNTEKSCFFNVEEVNQYVLSKVSDINEKGFGGKTIAFHLLNRKADISGKGFLNFLKIYNQLDLEVIDNRGRNLLHHAVLNEMPKQIISFLIRKKISLTHLDKDHYSLINYFPLKGFTQENVDFFKELIQKISINNEDSYGQSALDNWLTFSIGKNCQEHTRQASLKWLGLTLYLIKEDKFFYSPEDLLKIKQKLDFYKQDFFDMYSSTQYQDIKNKYGDAIKKLDFMILEHKIAPKASKSNKIKI